MRFLALTVFLFNYAQAAERISVQQFLDEVKKQSPQVQSLYLNVQSLEGRLREADLATSPVGYAAYMVSSDETPNSNTAFQGLKTESETLTLGLKQQTTFGLLADLSFQQADIEIQGASGLTADNSDYTGARATLSITQSLWKNSFGELTRAQRDAGRAAVRAELMQARYLWRTTMIQAENIYWTVASLQQVAKLQQANVESAQKLSDWMRGRQKLNLVDDVESLQTQAALQARDLELQNTQDQLNAALQSFYTLRGQASNAPVELDPLPEEEWAAQLKDLSNTKRHREDYEALRAKATAERAQAVATKSSLRPQLDLVGSYASNGRDPKQSDSIREVEDMDQPAWTVGVQFSVPLDFSLTNRLKEASRQKVDSAQYALQQATFDEARTWEDVIRRRKEAQARYEQALNLEKTRTRLVERERSRHRNGRTTTFQQITNEQDLASSQVLRVQSQLNLIQTHNQIKAFVEGL